MKLVLQVIVFSLFFLYIFRTRSLSLVCISLLKFVYIWRVLACSLWCQLWYPLSKTLAEKAAWDFAKENGLDIVVVHPGLVMGPILPPTLNGSMRMVLRLIQGNRFELLIVRSLILEVAKLVTDWHRSGSNSYYLHCRIGPNELGRVDHKHFCPLSLHFDRFTCTT